MQPRPSLDLELLIPIAIAVISILGLGWIFLTNFRSESPTLPTVEPTAIPVNSGLFETRTPPPPPSATPTLEAATPTLEEATPTATATSPISYPGLPVETLPSASTSIVESQPASSPSVTPDDVQAFPAGKYDDTHPKIAYDRNWVYKMNTGTKFAYKGTLHISNGIGSELGFHFTGRRVYLGYQRGRSFGTVTVIIDDQSYNFHEQAFGNIWRSPQLSPGTHSVTIIHDTGESINLDYIEVLP